MSSRSGPDTVSDWNLPAWACALVLDLLIIRWEPKLMLSSGIGVEVEVWWCHWLRWGILWNSYWGEGSKIWTVNGCGADKRDTVKNYCLHLAWGKGTIECRLAYQSLSLLWIPWGTSNFADINPQEKPEQLCAIINFLRQIHFTTAPLWMESITL